MGTWHCCHVRASLPLAFWSLRVPPAQGTCTHQVFGFFLRTLLHLSLNICWKLWRGLEDPEHALEMGSCAPLLSGLYPWARGWLLRAGFGLAVAQSSFACHAHGLVSSFSPHCQRAGGSGLSWHSRPRRRWAEHTPGAPTPFSVLSGHCLLQELYSWCPTFHSKRRGPKVKREAWATGPLGMLDPWLCCSLVERAHRQGLHSRGPGPSPRCCDLLSSVGGLVLLSALWILHGKGGKPPRSLRVPSLEVFLSCYEIQEVLGPSCPHVHLQWASHVCLAFNRSPSKNGRGRGCSWAPPEVRRWVPMTTKPCTGGRVSG